jgi:hypothetical protein
MQKTDDPTITEEVIEQLEDGEREPTGDEIREYGIIKTIEDAEYPMFVVTVEFPERQTTADFNINIEALPQSDSDLYALKGKYATIYYEDDSENMLMDIHFNGKTLYGKDAPEIDDSYKSITGILSGAETETAGDLPNTIYITDKDGVEMPFKEFIISEVVAKNGKTVTGYYYTRYNQTITYIKESKN